MHKHIKNIKNDDNVHTYFDDGKANLIRNCLESL